MVRQPREFSLHAGEYLFAANPFLIGLQNFLSPKFAHEFHKNGSDGLYRATVRAVLVIAAVMGVFCLAMLLFGGSILTIVYGEKYAGYGVVIAVLALVQLVSAVNVPLTSSLMAMERTDVEFKCSLAAVVVMSTIGIWLVRGYGPLGVAFGLLSGNLVSLTYRLGRVQPQRQSGSTRSEWKTISDRDRAVDAGIADVYEQLEKRIPKLDVPVVWRRTLGISHDGALFPYAPLSLRPRWDCSVWHSSDELLVPMAVAVHKAIQ